MQTQTYRARINSILSPRQIINFFVDIVNVMTTAVVKRCVICVHIRPIISIPNVISSSPHSVMIDLTQVLPLYCISTRLQLIRMDKDK